jgi:hypothetical protein
MSEPESSTASGTMGSRGHPCRSTTPFLPNFGSGAGLRVERHHVVARRHDDHALLACRRSSRRGRARRTGAAPSASGCPRRAVHPQRLAVSGSIAIVDATRGGDGEQATVRVQRRGAVVLVGSERAGVPLPGHLERIEVRRVDLVERRVARAPRIGRPSTATRRARCRARGAIEPSVGLSARRPAGMPFMRRMYASTSVYSSSLSEPGSVFGISSRMYV